MDGDRSCWHPAGHESDHGDAAGDWPKGCRCGGTCLDCRAIGLETADRLINSDGRTNHHDHYRHVVRLGDIAAGLGDWTVGNDGNLYSLDGVHIRIGRHLSWRDNRGGKHQERLTVRGQWPRHPGSGAHVSDGADVENIELSASKPTHVIVNEIKRRLLKPWIPRHVQALANGDVEHARVMAQQQARAAFIVAYGSGATERRHLTTEVSIADHPIYSVGIHSPTEAHVPSFTCTPEQALQILRLLKRQA